jgi:hypothetical protein
MDCDGKKKSIVKDLDGSFVGGGRPATLLPDSAYEWDGDRSRGLGDYRIPRAALTAPDGTREPVFPEKGM